MAPFFPIGYEITHSHAHVASDPLATVSAKGGASATTGGYTCLRCRLSATCFTHIKFFDHTQPEDGVPVSDQLSIDTDLTA
jgi:hypothetical protein